jgi:hypothetical protein
MAQVGQEMTNLDPRHAAFDRIIRACIDRPDIPALVKTDLGVIHRTPAAPSSGSRDCVEIWLDGVGCVVSVPDRSGLHLKSWQVPFDQMDMSTRAGLVHFSQVLAESLASAGLALAGRGAGRAVTT